jgi:hypothetical protein
MRLYSKATLQIRCNYDAIWWRSSEIQARLSHFLVSANHLSHLFCDANSTSAAGLALQNLQKAAFVGGEG